MAPEVSGLVLGILLRGIQKSSLKLGCLNWAEAFGGGVRCAHEGRHGKHISNSYAT